jgi:pyrrolysine biosynthesis protein PylD
MADDEVFTAFSTRNGVFSDNSWATGRGFAAALCLMMTQRGENPVDAEVLVLGAGPVGSAAAAYFSHRGIPAALADLDEAKARQAAEKLPGIKAVKKPACLRSYPYLLDATPAAAFITEGDVTEKTLISAPGMPLGVSGEALKTALVFHNPLELGVMTMYYECASKFHT